jgi:hypothetical protein
MEEVARKVKNDAHSGYLRSSFCGSGDCVEVTRLSNGNVAVRDSKNRQQAGLVYTADEWLAFLRGAKAGEFDFDLNGGAGLDSATIRFAR